jgi:Icc protein
MAGAVQVLQVSDLHLLREMGHLVYGQDSDTNLNKALGRVEEEYSVFDLVIATGDIAEDAAAASYQRVLNHLRGLAPAMRWIPGNHDDPETMRAVASEEMLASIEIQGWSIIPLNTRRPEHDEGQIAPTELDRLRTLLERSSDRHALIALHHPTVELCDNPICKLTNRSELWNVLTRYQHVRAVISGHLHRAFDQEHDGIRLLGAPSTCVQVNHTDHTFTMETPAVRVLELRTDGSVSTAVLSAST